MLIGIPKEIKNHEYRVALTPYMVQALTSLGHEVRVESGAGVAIGYDDAAYAAAGANVCKEASRVWEAELVVKVKEPQATEYPFLRPGLAVLSFFHLAADAAMTQELLDRGVTVLACETITGPGGVLPILMPMSIIAGRIAVHVGAYYQHLSEGGRGVLMGGCPGVPSAKVVILGGGIAGTEAIRVAIGMGADVTVIERRQDVLYRLDTQYSPSLHSLYFMPAVVEEAVTHADIVIGAVHAAGKATPKIISRGLISRMRPGAVFIDISIDQGGCSETSRATTHTDPTYVVDGVIHYCVANMPGACARTATEAYGNQVLPFVTQIATLGVRHALVENPHLRQGLNLCQGKVTHPSVAEDLGYAYHDALDVAKELV